MDSYKFQLPLHCLLCFGSTTVLVKVVIITYQTHGSIKMYIGLYSDKNIIHGMVVVLLANTIYL